MEWRVTENKRFKESFSVMYVLEKKKSSERLNVRTNGQIGSKRTNIVVRFTEIYKWFYTYMAAHDTTQLIFAIIDVNDR